MRVLTSMRVLGSIGLEWGACKNEPRIQPHHSRWLTPCVIETVFQRAAARGACENEVCGQRISALPAAKKNVTTGQVYFLVGTQLTKICMLGRSLPVFA